MIIGIGEIESDWYLGKINSMEGIFPITHTWELDSSMIKVKIDIGMIHCSTISKVIIH